MAKREIRHQGNLAYKPQRRSSPEEERQRREWARYTRRQRARQQRQQRKAHAQSLQKLRIREQMAVSPLALVSLAVIAVLATVILMGYARLNTINSQVVSVRSTLSQLETEEKSLMATYEQTFDMQEIETRLLDNGLMVEPGSSQKIYLELTEPDSSNVYTDESTAQKLWEQLGRLAEYFR